MSETEILIRKSLNKLLELKSITDTKEESTEKLVFPITRAKSKRISEQEARFLFVNQIEVHENYKCHYAVEAPTMQKYSFSGEVERSGNIDLCIYENGKRSNLIEFKALNHISRSYSKDFEKLFFDYDSNYDNELCNFFVQILEHNNINIENKLNEAIKDSMLKYRDKDRSEVIVFVCTLVTKQIKKYKIVDFLVVEVIEQN